MSSLCNCISYVYKYKGALPKLGLFLIHTIPYPNCTVQTTSNTLVELEPCKQSHHLSNNSTVFFTCTPTTPKKRLLILRHIPLNSLLKGSCLVRLSVCLCLSVLWCACLCLSVSVSVRLLRSGELRASPTRVVCLCVCVPVPVRLCLFVCVSVCLSFGTYVRLSV